VLRRKKDIKHWSDDQLIKACLNLKPFAQQELVRRYSPALKGVTIRYMRSDADAQDALQEGLIRIFKYLDKYKPSGSFKSWAYRVVINICLRKLEQQSSRNKTNSQYAYMGTDHILPDSYSTLSCQEILGLLDYLPEQQRLVFNLKIIEGYNHSEIAELLSISESTSRSNLTRGRKTMQELILKKNKIAV